MILNYFKAIIIINLNSVRITLLEILIMSSFVEQLFSREINGIPLKQCEKINRLKTDKTERSCPLCKTFTCHRCFETKSPYYFPEKYKICFSCLTKSYDVEEEYYK